MVRYKRWLLNNQDFLVVNLILLIKAYLLTTRAGYNPLTFWFLISSAAILCLMSCWITLLPGLMRLGTLLLYDIVVTLLLLADLMFLRFFHRLMPIPAIYQVNQLQGISQSVAAGVAPLDLLFAVDLVLLIPYLSYVYGHLKNNPLKLRVRVAQVLIVGLLSCGAVLFKLGDVGKAYGGEAINNIYTNNEVLSTMGVLSFHGVDAYNTFIKQEDKHLDKKDALSFLGWTIAHQAKTSELQGVAAGKNLIIVQLESAQGFLIGRSVNNQEVTPNLNKLRQSSMYFDNIFVQVAQGNSSDAEFMVLNSLYPQGAGVNFMTYAGNTYQALPGLLKSKGYSTLAVHGDAASFWNRDKIYPSFGIDRFYSRSELKNTEVIGMGLSDKTVFSQAASILENTKKPFMSMIISLSGHHPYVIPKGEQSLNIPTGEFSEVFSNYLQSQHYADQALGEFLNQLERDGILDNSVLIVYGDHFGIGWEDSDVKAFLKRAELGEFDQTELRKVPLFIRLPKGQNAGVKHEAGGQIDIFPTVANLMGLDKQKLIYFGQDLLNESGGFSLFRYYNPDGSFATDDYLYLANWDGVFEHGHAYNRKTGQPVDVNLCKAGYEEAKTQLRMSDQILRTNGIEDLLALNK